MPWKKYIDLSGRKFGKLLVINRDYSKDYERPYYLCRCDCGNEVLVAGSQLTRTTYSATNCGCERWLCKRKPIGESSFRSLYLKYKCSAKKRKYKWDLSEKDFRDITSQDCYYCGKAPEQHLTDRKYNGDYLYNGVDRVDNKKGYNKQNCVPCCEVCNRMKLNYSLDFFLNHIKRICDNRNI